MDTGRFPPLDKRRLRVAIYRTLGAFYPETAKLRDVRVSTFTRTDSVRQPDGSAVDQDFPYVRYHWRSPAGHYRIDQLLMLAEADARDNFDRLVATVARGLRGQHERA